jgi:hypothetical protein
LKLLKLSVHSGAQLLAGLVLGDMKHTVHFHALDDISAAADPTDLNAVNPSALT